MIHIVDDLDLRPRNTFGMAATCARWIEYTDAADIPSIVDMLDKEGCRRFHVGAGSNLLIACDRYEGTMLHSAILSHEAEPIGNDTVRVVAGSGITMDVLCEWACQSGLWGLENLSLIPGEVGASAVQNVGAYGCEASDLIEYVELYDTEKHEFVRMQNSELCYGYRMSLMKQPEYKGRFIVVKVAFNLSTVSAPRLEYGNLSSRLKDVDCVTPMAVREAVCEVRREKLPDPCDIGSAGSFFKNPVIDGAKWEKFERRVIETLGPGIVIPHYPAADGMVKLSAAWLMDRAGCKQMNCGGAGVWNKQPLVLVNLTGNATWQDVSLLQHKVTEAVESMFGVTLSPEVERICN